MEVFKTKEAAEQLGVSPATIKRWVSFFSQSFDKDQAGHYRFTIRDMEKLRRIKEQLDQGVPLNRIALAERKKPEASPSSVPNGEDVLRRIGQLEYKLAQKADDVVTLQVLEHRRELEEIRDIVQRLEQYVETLKATMSQLHPVNGAHPKIQPAPEPAKRRGLLGTLFGMLP